MKLKLTNKKKLTISAGIAVAKGKCVSDFTVYLSDGSPFLFQVTSVSGDKIPNPSINGSLNTGGFDIGRYIACPCFRKKHWSVTARVDALKKIKSGTTYYPLLEWGASDFAPKNVPNDTYPISIESVCQLLHARIFETTNDPRPHGVIVVSGATSSAKSLIARGLIHTYLRKKMFNENRLGASSTTRRPHLLTVEDPIEQFYFGPEGPDAAQKYGLDYTPREIGLDTPCIEDAFKDALRQTPAVVYVGEVRTLKDWEHVVDFAGTGHLVVTTAHAGSLVEAMDRIFRANGADTPIRRGHVASSLLAIVQLQGIALKGGKDVKLPALWRRTPGSVAALISDGLASVLPQRVGGLGCGSLGRLYFVEELCALNRCMYSTNDVESSSAFVEKLMSGERSIKFVHELWRRCTGTGPMDKLKSEESVVGSDQADLKKTIASGLNQLIWHDLSGRSGRKTKVTDIKEAVKYNRTRLDILFKGCVSGYKGDGVTAFLDKDVYHDLRKKAVEFDLRGE